MDKYTEIINKHSLGERVLLHTKFIPERDIPLYFSAADVCVLPYRSGTQSGIEGVSYHFGLPVIVTDVGGLKETAEKHKTGLVVPRAEVNPLKEAIAKYFEGGSPPAGSPPAVSPPTGLPLRELFEINIAEYKKQYSWDKFSEALVKFCEWV